MRLLKCLFAWRVRYPNWEKFTQVISVALFDRRPVVIVTHDICMAAGNRPGRGNELLAEALKHVSDLFPDIPILATIPVVLAAEMKGVKVTVVIHPPHCDTPMDRSTMEYNSKTVVEAQKRWLIERGQFPALALALTTPFHMPRVKWIMEKEGFEVLPIPLPTPRQFDYMDRNSLYFSVRVAARVPGGLLLAYGRELCARLLFFWKGWI